MTFGTKTVFEYSPEWWGPLATFRASGRMFWPVYYTCVFTAIAVVVQRLPFRSTVVVMLCAVGLQAADLAGVYRLKRTGYAMQMADPLPSDFWDIVPRYYKHIVLYPSNMCAPLDQGLDYRFFALHAGYVGATINGGYAARYDVDGVARYCQGSRATCSRELSPTTAFTSSVLEWSP